MSKNNNKCTCSAIQKCPEHRKAASDAQAKQGQDKNHGSQQSNGSKKQSREQETTKIYRREDDIKDIDQPPLDKRSRK